MPNKDKELTTPEGFKLRFRKTETVELKIDIPAEVLAALEETAQERNVPLKALIKFYIGQGLRQDLGQEKTNALLKRRLKSGASGKSGEVESDLAA